MNKKKVLIVSDYFVPHWTGIVSSITYLIDQMYLCYDFSVLTINHTNKLPAREKRETVQIIRAPSLFSISRTKFSLMYLLEFVRILHSYDIVFINSPNSSVLFFSSITKLWGKRIVIFHQGDLILTPGFFNRIIEGVFDFQTKLSCVLANAVGTYSKDYATHSRILSHVMHKMNTFMMIPNKTSSTKKRNIERGIATFGFAGRYVQEKGIDVLLKAIELVIKKTTKVHFYFAGKEPTYEKNAYFEKFSHLSKYITDLGLLNQVEMNTFLSSLDYLILPSRSECLGQIQLEAFQHNVPVIASDNPGMRVPVKKTQFGFLFENENSTQLAEVILQSILQQKSINTNLKNVERFLNPTQYEPTIRKFIG